MQRKKYPQMDKVLIHYEEFDDTTTTDRNSVRHSFNETVYCKKQEKDTNAKPLR